MSEQRSYTTTEMFEIRNSLDTLTTTQTQVLYVLGFLSGFAEQMQGRGTEPTFYKCAEDLDAAIYNYSKALGGIRKQGLLTYDMSLALHIAEVAFRLTKALRDYAWIYSDADWVLIRSLPDKLLEGLSSLQIVRNTQ